MTHHSCGSDLHKRYKHALPRLPLGAFFLPLAKREKHKKRGGGDVVEVILILGTLNMNVYRGRIPLFMTLLYVYFYFTV